MTPRIARLIAVAFLAACFGCGGATLTKHQVAEDLTIHQIELSVSNVFIVEGTEGAVLVDAGNPKQQWKILKAIDRTGVSRDAIRAIVITHAHADHTGSAKALAAELEVPIIIQHLDAERAALGRNPKLPPQNLTAVFLKWFLKHRWEPYEADEPYSRCVDLRQWGIEGVVRSAPAHTAGSSIIELDHGVVLVGDLLAGGFFGGAFAARNPESHYYQEDAGEVRAILRHLTESGAKTLFVGHGGPLDVVRVADELKGTEFGRGDEEPWRPTPCDVMR